MGRGSEEEAIVIVKPGADDPEGTQVRIKHRISAKEAGGEGWTMEAVTETHLRPEV